MELAAPGADASGREAAPGRADRFGADGRKDHAEIRPGASEAYGRRGFPTGHLPRGTAGPAESAWCAAGTLLRIPDGTAHGKCGTGHDGHPADVRQLQPPETEGDMAVLTGTALYRKCGIIRRSSRRTPAASDVCPVR